ncbi:MAG: flagellar filament capping protein FliD [Burkholderiaceae bacterium]
MAVDSSGIVSALGAGSGINIRDLAKGLTDAEINPRKNAIQAKIDRSEAKISGYSAMMAAMDVFKASVEQVDSTTDFASTTARVSNSSALSVSTSSLAAPGSHSIDIHSLARAQRSNSDTGFANITSQVNGGNAFDLTFTVGPVGSQTSTTVSIDQASTNLSAVASAINLSGAGVSAQVLDTGNVDAADRYRLVLTGRTGADNVFTVSSTATDPTEFAFSTPVGQAASDASLTVNGVSITRATNTIDDVISGVTLDLQATTSSASSLTVVRDATGVKEKVQSIVQAYNNLVSDFGVLSGPASDDPDDIFSGSLRGDSTVRTVLSQIRQIFFGESETAGDSVKSFRDLGVSVDKDGVVTLDEATLDATVTANFEEVVQVLAARQSTVENGETVIKRGLGVTLATRLRDLMSPTGIIMSQSSSAESQVSRYETQLEDLEERMSSLLERYTKQFAAMESLVGQITAMRENLKGQFENLANAYKN